MFSKNMAIDAYVQVSLENIVEMEHLLIMNGFWIFRNAFKTSKIDCFICPR